MEPNSRQNRHKKEVLYVAQDVFHFLSAKRFAGQELKKPCEKSNYHENIGKACAYMLQLSGQIFREILARHYPDHPMGSKCFVTWFRELIIRNYSKEPCDPFSQAIESLGLMFEAISYGIGKGHTNLYKILPYMWTEYFMNNLYPDFFDKGGWNGFRRKARDVAGTYQRFFVMSEPEAMELIAGMKEDVPIRVVEGAEGGFDPTKMISVPLVLQRAGYPPKVHESSSLAQTIKGLMNIKIEGALQPAIQEAYEKHNTPQATSKESLPGFRKVDPITPHREDSPVDSYPSSPEEAVPGSSKVDDSSLPKFLCHKSDVDSEAVSEACFKTDGEESCKREGVGADPKKKSKRRTSFKRN